jgi:hypothetical protein
VATIEALELVRFRVDQAQEEGLLARRPAAIQLWSGHTGEVISFEHDIT